MSHKVSFYLISKAVKKMACSFNESGEKHLQTNLVKIQHEYPTISVLESENPSIFSNKQSYFFSHKALVSSRKVINNEICVPIFNQTNVWSINREVNSYYLFHVYFVRFMVHGRHWGQQRRCWCWSQPISGNFPTNNISVKRSQRFYLEGMFHMFLYSIAQVPSERTVKLISSPMPEYGETKSENSTSIHSSDALRKNTRSPIYWASKEDHSNHFSLIKALRKNAMASANDFLSILPVAQNAANCLYMPSKGTLTPSPVRERMHVGPLECKGDHPEIGATRCGVTRSGGEGVVRDLVVNDAFKDGACLAAFGSDFFGSNLLVGFGTHPVFWRSFGTHTSGELSGRGGCLDGYGVIGAQPGVSKKSFVHLRNLAVHLQSSSKQVFSDFAVKVCRYSNENQALHSNFANVKEVHLLLSVCWAACGPYGRSHNPGGSSGGEAALQASLLTQENQCKHSDQKAVMLKTFHLFFKHFMVTKLICLHLMQMPF